MTKKTNKNYFFVKKLTVFLLTTLMPIVVFSSKTTKRGLDFDILANKTMVTEVTGVVTDNDGQPLPGATVFIKGTNKGTQTDFDGRFILDVKDGETIAITYVGFETQEILFNGQQTLNVSLQISTDALTEVVVVGYSSKSTRDITGSVEVVDVEELQKTAPLSIEQALQGQASGVTVGNQGGPGGTAAVRIRGFSSLNGADPLYVIDGTPTGSGINEINPSDIESIQVLKDASSAAIYGNRAANGVIIVTTKKGKKNQKQN
ncbi:TonB-dependent receptor plug domain-containing protein [Aquimarina agarivorans]|uniref:TonB-dependent receptor plug domain-containing protein n=1 Tax=Aquimarina agarivorans TaxID=980584 RepID=UPI000248EFA1|nr:TonB-dependent receptor plug domain-containing protein [Aquimarina agarivorans]